MFLTKLQIVNAKGSILTVSYDDKRFPKLCNLKTPIVKTTIS